MICDPDDLISLNRDSSKTRLMGTNVHPSRRTGGEERREEGDENTISKCSSRSGSFCSTGSHMSNNDNTHTNTNTNTNANVHIHELNYDNNSHNNNNGHTHGHNHNLTMEENTNKLNAINLLNNNIELTSSSMRTYATNVNDKTYTNSFNAPGETNELEKAKMSTLASIASNLNLLEGDLPQAMLDNFDIPSGPLTPSIAAVVMNVLKQGGKLSFKSAHKILRISYKFLSELPNTTKCEIGPNDRLTVVGDLHGTYALYCCIVRAYMILTFIILFFFLLFVILILRTISDYVKVKTLNYFSLSLSPSHSPLSPPRPTSRPNPHPRGQRVPLTDQ
jgi:hypothetical protein